MSRWLHRHRETITSLLIIFLILAGLVIIWGGGPKTQSENREGEGSMGTALVIPPIVNEVPVKTHDDLAAERTLWEQASYDRTTTTMRAARSQKKRSVVRGTGDLPPSSVQQCESRGDYTAENPTSSASGGWQITDGTWGGYGGYGHASDAPKEVQDAKARELWANGKGAGHWKSCL